MKRAILAIGFIVSCFLPMFVSGPAFAQSEATHDRAAGHIEYTKRNSHQLRIIDFDIHEAYVHHPANGTMTYTIKDARNENVLLIMEFDVVYVNIRGNTAKFIAYCTDASNNGPKAGNANNHIPGEYFIVVIYDLATPGGSGDIIRHRWEKDFVTAVETIGSSTDTTRGLEQPSGIAVEEGDARITLAD